MTVSNMISRSVVIVFICIHVLNISVYSDDVKQSKNDSWKNKQLIWWDGPTIIIDNIRHLLKLEEYFLLPEKQRELDDHNWNIALNILLLDSSDSDAALKFIPELYRYNIGESAMEVISCVAVRKGRKIIPFLRAELTKDFILQCSSNKTATGCKRNTSRTILINATIKNIEDDIPCYIEE